MSLIRPTCGPHMAHMWDFSTGDEMAYMWSSSAAICEIKVTLFCEQMEPLLIFSLTPYRVIDQVRALPIYK